MLTLRPPEKSMGPRGSPDHTLRTAALDKCSLDLRQGCSQAWGWDPAPVQSILEWCVVYMHTPGLRI